MVNRGHSRPVCGRDQATFTRFRLTTAARPTRIGKASLLGWWIGTRPLTGVRSLSVLLKTDKARKAYLAVPASIERLNYDKR
jgi:hypothetical protein